MELTDCNNATEEINCPEISPNRKYFEHIATLTLQLKEAKEYADQLQLKQLEELQRSPSNSREEIEYEIKELRMIKELQRQIEEVNTKISRLEKSKKKLRGEIEDVATDLKSQRAKVRHLKRGSHGVNKVNKVFRKVTYSKVRRAHI
jgi:chromosome segregation ATPase